MNKMIKFLKQNKALAVILGLLSIFLISTLIIRIDPKESDSSVQQDINIIGKIKSPIDGHDIVFDHKSKFQIRLDSFSKFVNSIDSIDPNGYILVGIGLKEKSKKIGDDNKFKFSGECLNLSGISWDGQRKHNEIVSDQFANSCNQKEFNNRIQRDSILQKYNYQGFYNNKKIGIAYKIKDAKIFLDSLVKEKRVNVYLDFIVYDNKSSILFSNVNNIRKSNNQKKDLKIPLIFELFKLTPPGGDDIYGDRGQTCCQ